MPNRCSSAKVDSLLSGISRAHFKLNLSTVSGKGSLNYFTAQASELKEARQLHSRFPRQLKKAVLMAVQFREFCLKSS